MATVTATLRVVPGFHPSEHEEVTKILATRLDRRLARFTDDQVELEVSVKDRDTPAQRVALEGWIAASGRTRFVGTSTEETLMGAVREAGEDLNTQIDRFLGKRESARKG